MKTVIGLAIPKPTKFEHAIFRIELYRKANLDKESLRACVKYVAKTSQFSYQELVDKLRLNLED